MITSVASLNHITRSADVLHGRVCEFQNPPLSCTKQGNHIAPREWKSISSQHFLADNNPNVVRIQVFSKMKQQSALRRHVPARRNVGRE